MRSLSLAVTLALVLAIPAGIEVAQADGGDMPSKHDVREAKQAVTTQEGRIAAVQDQLAAANRQLEDAALAADRAYETWNGARYRLQQARKQAEAAERRARIAGGDVDRQRAAYADSLVSSYEQSPELAALSSIVSADGISSVVEQTMTMQTTEQALDSHYDAFRASATLADVAATQAEDARAEARKLATQARQARDRAQAAADAAAAQAQSVAEQKDQLIGELARLQNVSKDLAAQRQAALEKAAAEAAAEAAAKAAAKQAAKEARQQAAKEAAEKAAQEAAQQAAEQKSQQQSSQGSSSPAPTQPSQPQQPSSPPAPSGGSGAAISFAKAQLGEPYVWGASGPSSWDCSGLTMGAWRAGGKSLPHYSVAQYEQSTPISSSNLQPGDLVFWGSSSSPSSIYHVALYIGGGQIIHAPRTGRPVSQESMYYWTPPNFFARP